MDNKKSKKENKPYFAQKNNKKGQKPKFSDKPKKSSGRQGKQPISGFSTLSQVAGIPLKRSYHSSLPVSSPLCVNEPRPICPMCGEPIEVIADSFPSGNGYVHFDCMLESIKERETLEENQVVSYLGSGTFGVCQRDNEGKYTIVKKIVIEEKDENNAMKAYIEGLKA